MDRWTMEELDRTDNLEFAAAILQERKNRLNPYSSLSMKLGAAIKEIMRIRAEKEKFISRIVVPADSAYTEEAENSNADVDNGAGS